MIPLPPEGREQMPTWAGVVLYTMFAAQVAFIAWCARYHRWLTANPALTDRVMGEEIDPESGLPHLAHALCGLTFLHYHAHGPRNAEYRTAQDDRVFLSSPLPESR